VDTLHHRPRREGGRRREGPRQGPSRRRDTEDVDTGADRRDQAAGEGETVPAAPPPHARPAEAQVRRLDDIMTPELLSTFLFLEPNF